jgi:hypothetical protein
LSSLPSRLTGKRGRMSKVKKANERLGWEAELDLLESLRWSRKEFLDRICSSSNSQEERVLGTLRLDATYQLAEFYFLIGARGIETEVDVKKLAELHNQYIVDIMKDPSKMSRIGLTRERALEAMFTSDTMPRLLQNWLDKKGAIDQSNLARLLMSVMSTETCRKIVVGCAEAGYLNREKTPYGTIVVSSNGKLEEIFGSCIRDLRKRIQGAF